MLHHGNYSFCNHRMLHFRYIDLVCVWVIKIASRTMKSFNKKFFLNIDISQKTIKNFL